MMQEKVHISENRRVTFFEAENKKRVLAISTHTKTSKTDVENGYFLKSCKIDRCVFKTHLNI